MLVSHSDLGIILQTREQAELCSLYQERYFFDGTFDCAPFYFYQMCPLRLFIPQYKSYELGAIALYELYTRHWFKCVLSLADLIINIDLS